MPTPDPPHVAVPAGYRELVDAVAWAPLPDRGVLEVAGSDAVRFVDGFTTAGLARLVLGGGSEGFFTDVRGWVMALGHILRDERGLSIELDRPLVTSLHEHLERYHIREDVTFTDASDDTVALLLAGPEAEAWLADRIEGVPPARPLDHRATTLGGTPVRLMRTDWYGIDGFQIRVAATAASAFEAWLEGQGLPRASAAAVETIRIEAGSPAFGDIPAKTLPQELGRDARAISFTKGCYLGQETVARIDALGHVNRRLVTLALAPAAGPGPQVGTAVSCEGVEVGIVTSLCHAPRRDQPLALALLHARGLADGAVLRVADAEARVVTPPAAGG